MRTLRFWSDEGLVPADRNGAGHRVYGPAAVARLDLVRTLRELGLGLDDVRAVLSRRRGVGEIAAAHVRALDDRIRELRAQRAVCALLARTGAGDTLPDERSVTLMNDLARLSAAQRQHLIDDFVTETFAGIDDDAPGAGIATGMRSMPAELPDDPTPEQVGAWVELAELVADPGFRARCREMAVAGATAPEHREQQADPAAVAEHAGAALAAASTRRARRRPGSSPASPASRGRTRRPAPGPRTASSCSPTVASSATGRCSGCSTAGRPGSPRSRRSSGSPRRSGRHRPVSPRTSRRTPARRPRGPAA